MRLVRGTPVGHLSHRSGWPFVLSHLNNAIDNKGMLLDDFTERTLTYGKMQRPIQEPWLGFFHHPPFTAAQCNLVKRLGLPLAPIQHYIQIPEVQESLKWLRGVIVLSEYAKVFYKPYLKAPIWSVKYPCDFNKDIARFSYVSFKRNPILLHYGWYLKIIPLLGYINSNGWQKICIVPNAQIAVTYMEQQFKILPSVQYNDVLHIPRVSNNVLDNLLSRCVVVTEYIELSASTVITECIARNTPLITKRHPAAEEYLGKNYPGFYERREDIEHLLTLEKIKEIHLHLRAMNKESLTIESFIQNLQVIFSLYE